MMTNFEWILQFVKQHDIDMSLDCWLHFMRTNNQDCRKEECIECRKKTLKWLQQEYEPPLLENGDGLKPGDLIMARNFEGDKWEKRRFLFYYDGFFYCKSKFELLGKSATVISWKQARLPMEGE